jgi:LmbE family N-acetylglucosaminyl deacetylase
MARILLIEDDPFQVALVQRWLPDHTVEVCTEGHQAQALAAEGWDLVISDVEVPGLDGLELLRMRGAATAPTLIITSHTEFDIALRAMKLGANDLLPKPFTRTDLRRCVTKLLEANRNSVRRVLAIGAHPDDVEIGVGGILAQHRYLGHRVGILTLSRGAAGGKSVQREREAKQAAKILDAELYIKDLPDTRISHGPDTIDTIERVINELRPDVIYVHSPRDLHQDHRATYEATRVAARDVPSLYAYQGPSTTIEFRPTRFVDVESNMSRKLAALTAYKSQACRAYLDPEMIRSTAAYWGRFAQYQLVEPLEVVKLGGNPQ